MRIIELFHSIQGEGLHIGKPTFFIRTATCNLRCTWCLHGETKITFSKSLSRRIEDVKIGDKLLAYDEQTGRITETTVSKKMSRVVPEVYRITFSNGKSLTVSRDHPIFTKRGWVLARNLEQEDEVLVQTLRDKISFALAHDDQTNARGAKSVEGGYKPLKRNTIVLNRRGELHGMG